MEGTSQIWPVIVAQVAALFGAFGNYFYKLGAARLGVISIFKNWQIGVGVISFTVVMVCFILSFKLGGRLAVVYPVYATTFLWAFLIGTVLDREPWNVYQLVGILFIAIGVAFVAGFASR